MEGFCGDKTEDGVELVMREERNALEVEEGVL